MAHKIDSTHKKQSLSFLIKLSLKVIQGYTQTDDHSYYHY